ncbi:MAG: phosphatidylserine decarboxylase family protein [Cyclobacteriaceae bacterium]
MTIHKEGHKTLFWLLIVLFAINYAMYQFTSNDIWQRVVLVLSIVKYLMVLQFFRNPKISINKNPLQILSPADGKIVVIENVTEDEYLEEPRIQISVFMSPINVHINRNPVDGSIEFFKYHKGKFLPAFQPKSSAENERTTIVYTTPGGVKILIRQIAGAVARRIRWYIKPGDQVEQGQEFGFIKFGSRVDVFVPTSAKVKVKEGDITKGGKTVLAEL